jgi:hypothetical protein
MKPKVGRMLGVAWLCGLLSPLSAQEPKLRDTLKGHTDCVWEVVYSPVGNMLASGSGYWGLATSCL